MFSSIKKVATKEVMLEKIIDAIYEERILVINKIIESKRAIHLNNSRAQIANNLSIFASIIGCISAVCWGLSVNTSKPDSSDWTDQIPRYSIIIGMLCLITTLIAPRIQDYFENESKKIFIDNIPNTNNSLLIKANKLLTKLESDFEELTSEEKMKLVNYNLAFMDDKKEIYLKYTCPISMSLIIQPLEVFVSGRENPELFDALSLNNHLLRSKLSPLSRLPIVKIDFNLESHERHKAYLLSLQSTINNIFKNRENAELNIRYRK